MSWSTCVMLLAGVPALELSTSTPYDNYTTAYHVARCLERPLVVVLNPERDSEQKSINFETLRTDENDKQLLKDYVVAVIDTGTPHGRSVKRLFGDKPLPYLSIIDKSQKLQVFRTSDPVSGERLKQILETHRKDSPPQANSAPAARPRIIRVNARTFESDVIEQSRQQPVIVAFTLATCGPCRALEPVLEKVAGQFAEEVVVAKVDVAESPELASKFGVESTPHLLVVRDGKHAGDLAGLVSEDKLRTWFASVAPAMPDVMAEVSEAVQAKRPTVR